MMAKHILIVENEEDSLRLITDVIHGLLGHEVLVARDGHEAIDMAHEHQPDLILMDLGIPKLNGLEVTRSLKQSEQAKHIPIMALTAYTLFDDRERALNAGCDEFVTKPIDIAALVALVKRYLNDSG
jgi:two-component system cell cycle response regulator DivK